MLHGENKSRSVLSIYSKTYITLNKMQGKERTREERKREETGKKGCGDMSASTRVITHVRWYIRSCECTCVSECKHHDSNSYSISIGVLTFNPLLWVKQMIGTRAHFRNSRFIAQSIA